MCLDPNAVLPMTLAIQGKTACEFLDELILTRVKVAHATEKSQRLKMKNEHPPVEERLVWWFVQCFA